MCVCDVDYNRQVVLVDYGSERTVSKKDLWVLPSSCASPPGFALRCHLADAEPAGDVPKWSLSACEMIKNRLTKPTACFLAPKVSRLFRYVSHSIVASPVSLVFDVVF